MRGMTRAGRRQRPARLQARWNCH